MNNAELRLAIKKQIALHREGLKKFENTLFETLEKRYEVISCENCLNMDCISIKGKCYFIKKEYSDRIARLSKKKINLYLNFISSTNEIIKIHLKRLNELK
ncbi:MAG: hypothetical protein COZ18_07765 [Flexibacter sp. CG_4_10_14_3_um_filter_32_15]|nr:MAG: hypothetical protein COZ18_07765 [Flexibacter sp. CG_4_10_14_3_um_filter_32_15]